jgi:acetylornithine deacetylase/succinyl-diaminopimelate desuccinylase-like protein
VATPTFDDESRYVRELVEFLRIPSVSRDPERPGQMRRAADWIAQQLAFAGGRAVETEGHPVVLGEWLGAAGRSTILAYGHYDVQRPGNEADWDNPPFEPTIRDWRIHARGASDDKGPLLVRSRSPRRTSRRRARSRSTCAS